MSILKSKESYFKFFIYFIVIVLINLVGVSLFYRVDLTSNKLYSLSKASRDVVKTLSEPLTIKIFFSTDLPAPHNNTERYLHDLMKEYASFGGKYFNYKFYDVTSKEGESAGIADRNRKIAEDYGISPVQIRIIKNDALQFRQAYMGLVIIHGDLIERIPAITSTQGLEYKITTAIQHLNNKISALLRLKGKVKITMYLSSSLNQVAPLIGLHKLASLPEKVKTIVDKLNQRSFNKIDFKNVDPVKEDQIKTIGEKYHIMTLKWPSLPEKHIKGGSGCAGIVMQYKDKVEEIPLITSIKIPVFGTQYQMANPKALGEAISAMMDRMIGINREIGYLHDHGTSPMTPEGMGMMGMQRGTMTTFDKLLSKRYSIKFIDLKKNGIPEGLNCLIISRPTKKFSNYDLFEIDQALMRGTNLAIFPDAFNEVMPGQHGMYGRGPQYVPIDTGLAKLLKHYGIKVRSSYVMDESCYKQTIPASQGGGERKLYFVPMIKDATINNKPVFMKNIKTIVTMKISPLSIDKKQIKKLGIKEYTLFSSSPKSWEMKDIINLNPMLITPPADKSKMRSYPLAVMLEGKFTSYFAGKPIPVKDVTKASDKKKNKNNSGKNNADKNKANSGLSDIQTQNRFIKVSKPGKIFIMACSAMLQNNMLDLQGRTTNATFILNVIDHLNNEDDIAAMRSKNQMFNPLMETTPFVRSFIKIFNIAALPVLVILFGFGVWLKRNSRKKHIKMMFSKKTEA